ncbi:MAG: hypothetical protein H6706_11545 [Myxococcales bacterium]|nr:hypothetical protein [Myxococcales bacterium]
MDHAALARRFDQVAEALGPAGHGIIIRRARALLAGGAVGDAIAFLREASRRQALPGVGQLAGELEAWQGSGGKAAALLALPAWRDGQARDDQVAREIAALTDGADLGQLTDRLAQIISGDAGRVTGPQAIGSIFGAREKPAAVVEADSHLVPVELGLDDVAPRAASDLTSAPPLPSVAPETAPPRFDAISAVVPRAPEAVGDDGPTVVTDPPYGEEEEAEELGPDLLESAAELPAVSTLPAPPPPPTEVEVVTPPAAPATTDGGALGVWVGLALFIIAVVLVVFFTR